MEGRPGAAGSEGAGSEGAGSEGAGSEGAGSEGAGGTNTSWSASPWCAGTGPFFTRVVEVTAHSVPTTYVTRKYA
jgi:hypothetical protein